MLTTQQRGLVAAEFYSTLWGNPNLETNLTVIPKLLNPARPVQVGVNLRNIELTLPGDVRYNLYAIGPYEIGPLRGGKMSVGKWLPLTAFMDKHDSHLRLSFRDSLYVPKADDCYVINLIGNGTFVLVPYEHSIRDKELLLTIRVSKMVHDFSINSLETVLSSESAKASLVARIQSDPRQNLKEYIVDNRWLRDVQAGDVTGTSTVLEIEDTSIQAVHEFSMDAMESYAVEGVPYYLLDLPTTPFQFLNYNDLRLFLVNGREGYFVPHLATNKDNRPNARQLGSHSYGLLGSMLESVMDELGWTAPETKLLVYVGSGDADVYRGNINYQFNMASLSAEQRRSALIGAIDGPHAFKATTLHTNALNNLINQPKPIVDAYEGSLYPIAETDRIFNYGVIDADVVEANLLNLSPQVKVAKVYENGSVVANYPTAIEASYEHLYMEHSNTLEVRRGNTLMAPLHNPVVYKEDGTLATLGTDYNVLDGAIVPVNPCLIMDLASSLSLELTLENENAAVPDLDAYLACCHIDVFGDDKLLHPGVDYALTNGRFYCYTPTTPTKVELKATPKLIDAVVESGWTLHGVISVNGTYLVEDPNSYFIWVDGKFYTAFELDWEEDFFKTTPSLPNAKPYVIIKRLLNDYVAPASAIQAERMAHEANLNEISAYANLTPPAPIPGPSVVTEHYQLRSWFMEEIIRQIIAGTIDYSKLAVQSRGLTNVIPSYLLDYLNSDQDPARKSWPTGVVQVLPHPDADPKTVPSDIYMFLETVNKELLNSAIQLNQFYRIQ